MTVTWAGELRRRVQATAVAGRWLHDPGLWTSECLTWPAGSDLVAYQADVLTQLATKRRVAVRGPHGLGKGATAAIAVLWFSTTRDAAGIDWKIPTTASAWRHLSTYLWPEIKKWSRLINWDVVGREPFSEVSELLALNLKLHHGAATAVASNRAELIEGAHADSLLYVVDEAKRLDVETPIPTPSGWTTMGDLRVGDEVLDEMGTPCQITYISPVLTDRPCSRITFDDGSEIVADDGHLWAVLSCNRRANLGQTHENDPRYKRKYESVRDWRMHWDRADIVTTAQLEPSPCGSAIPTCAPLELPEADLPIDPYVLGAWLGDGFSWHGAIASMDPEVIDRIRDQGYEVRPRVASKTTSCPTWGVIGLKTKLRAANLVRNKHVPAAYLRASYSQRLEMLRGLMDTDGTNMATGSPRVAFTVTNERLAEGVAELVRTFGWKVRVSKRRSKLNGIDKGPAFMLRWSADINPFHLARKADRWAPRPARSTQTTIRAIDSVERVPSVPTRCIAVDSPRRLYLAGEGFIPTHNTVPNDTWDAVEGALSGGRESGLPEAFVLALSTPGPPVGRFYDIHSRKPGYEDWTVRHVTLAEAVKAGRISAEWAAQRARQWGEDSAIYQNRVLGEFAASDEDAVIPLAWAEAAVERWHAWVDAGRPPLEGRRVLGVDVARSGSDATMFAPRIGPVVTELIEHRKRDTMAVTALVQGELDDGLVVPIVDTIGVGAGVLDRLRELGVPAVAYTGSAGTKQRDATRSYGFVNVRSAAYWKLRELLDPAGDSEIALPPDDLLLSDLTTPTWDITTGVPPKIRIETKDDVVARLGRSPDKGDAVVMAFAADWLGGGQSKVHNPAAAAQQRRQPSALGQRYGRRL